VIAYLGIDVGSVSTNLVVLTEGMTVLNQVYLRTRGQPITVLQAGLAEVAASLPEGLTIRGCGTTGSARQLAGVIAGADVIKNEITAHATATAFLVPGVRTIIEIGGQDSKIILLRDGWVLDFAMNTVCAAGTGSFLDQQAARLGIRIEDLGPMALGSKTPVRIAGRCTVFAESDMIHKQQLGHRTEDILYGLCEALVRNYLNNVARGKEITPPIAFQGGVASNVGIRRAFEETLGHPIVVTPYHSVTGAIGAAMLAREAVRSGKPSSFRGFAASARPFAASSFECDRCANHCEVISLSSGGEILARWGPRCPRWDLEDRPGVAGVATG
jgi:predicted CoA-substrate-specific enzyme activase